MLLVVKIGIPLVLSVAGAICVRYVARRYMVGSSEEMKEIRSSNSPGIIESDGGSPLDELPVAGASISGCTAPKVNPVCKQNATRKAEVKDSSHTTPIKEKARTTRRNKNPEAPKANALRSCTNPEVTTIIVPKNREVEKDYTSVNHNYKITPVLGDGRCLFRSIAHVAFMRNNGEAPDKDLQRELADDLRAQVVEELLKRRDELEWFIEGGFDAYVKRIQQSSSWGGEPELIVASHVLEMMILVYMIDRTSGELLNIANYGVEYRKEEVKPIEVLFHEYGHYDIVETFSS